MVSRNKVCEVCHIIVGSKHRILVEHTTKVCKKCEPKTIIADRLKVVSKVGVA